MHILKIKMQYGGKKPEAKFEVNATVSLGSNVLNPKSWMLF